MGPRTRMGPGEAVNLVAVANSRVAVTCLGKTLD